MLNSDHVGQGVCEEQEGEGTKADYAAGNLVIFRDSARELGDDGK